MYNILELVLINESFVCTIIYFVELKLSEKLIIKIYFQHKIYTVHALIIGKWWGRCKDQQTQKTLTLERGGDFWGSFKKNLVLEFLPKHVLGLGGTQVLQKHEFNIKRVHFEARYQKVKITIGGSYSY